MKKSNKIAIVTGNKSKFKEISTILKEEAGIKCSTEPLEILEPRALSLEEISMFKAKAAWKILKMPLITDDTGIVFEELGKFPGPYTKTLYEMMGLEGILKIVKGTNRRAFYETVLTFTNNGKDFHQVTGIYKGIIAEKISKQIDLYFPYDSIFVPTGHKRVRILLNPEERIKESHRRMAVKELVKFLKKSGFLENEGKLK